jgi:hypothetical protein
LLSFLCEEDRCMFDHEYGLQCLAETEVLKAVQVLPKIGG